MAESTRGAMHTYPTGYENRHPDRWGAQNCDGDIAVKLNALAAWPLFLFKVRATHNHAIASCQALVSCFGCDQGLDGVTVSPHPACASSQAGTKCRQLTMSKNLIGRL